MSQFGGGKPPGQWGRPGAPGGPGQLPGFPVNVGGFPMVGMGVPMGMVNQAAFSQPSMMGMQGLMGAVPQQQLASQQQSVRPQQQAPQSGGNINAGSGGKNQRTFVGVVTKMLDTYGFVDDDVFFQHSVIRGQHPRVGDKVMVEANYNPAMPFKWNAYRIQLLNASSQMAGNDQQQRSVNQQPPPLTRNQPDNGPSRWGGGAPNAASNDRNGRNASPGRSSRRSPPPRQQRSPPRRMSPPKRDPPARGVRDARRSPLRRASPARRVSPPARAERSDRKRERSPSNSVTTSSRRDSASPPRRRARIIPRYECRVPKPVLLSDVVSGATIRNRYNKLYIPSDYVDLSFEWVQKAPMDSSIDISNAVQFHAMHKDVEYPLSNELPNLEPEDADHRYQVKVLLLSHLGKQDIVKKAYCLNPDGSTDDHQEPQPLYKNISFLVGTRGKETLAIGGSWSPSLDGADPNSPATLIATAVRTTKALTGIDLSSVPQWYSMVQVRYYRADKNRVDKVHLLYPDTQLLPPDDATWQALTEAIAEQLKVKVAEVEALKVEVEEEPAPQVAETQTQVDDTNKVEKEVNGEELVDADKKASEETPSEVEKKADVTVSESTEDVSMTEDGAEQPPSTGPSHWSKLDPKSMKVAELRVELEQRGLETKGIKTLLVQRLQTVLDSEKATEIEPKGDVEMKDVSEVKTETPNATDEKKDPAAFIAPAVDAKPSESEIEQQKKADELKKKIEKLEKEKKEKKDLLEKHYQIPKEKKILVFPSKTAKQGKFECKVISLNTLLDYRSDDNKESQFEVSLFAEAFREMIERNAAFTIYDTLVNCGDKDAEKKRREEAREKPVEKKEEEEKKNETEEGEKREQSPKSTTPATEKIELKSIVANRTVYEAFSYFDSNLCGYLTEKDIEEILYSGELGISRGQVQRLSKKLSVRDKINYRHLTDVLTDSDGIVRHTPGGADDVVETDDLLMGYGLKFAKALAEPKESDSSNGVTTVSSDGVVVINGNVINVPLKLKKLKQMEQERNAAIATISEQASLIEQLREAKNDIEKKKKDVETYYHKANKKLNDTSTNLKASQEDNANLKQALLDCKKYADRIFGVVEKALPPPPKKEDKSKEKEKSSEKSVKKDEKSESSNNGTTPEKTEEPAVEMILAEEVGEEEERKEEEEKKEEVEKKEEATA